MSDFESIKIARKICKKKYSVVTDAAKKEVRKENDMDIDNQFIITHSENTTGRITPDLLRAILETLVKYGIEYNGRKNIKPLGDGVSDDGLSLIFDVKDPNETFDHIEFKVTKTGWGRQC